MIRMHAIMSDLGGASFGAYNTALSLLPLLPSPNNKIYMHRNNVTWSVYVYMHAHTCLLYSFSLLSPSHRMNHHLHLSLSTTSCSSFLKPCFFSLAAGPAGGPSGCGGLCLARNPPGESIVKRLTMLFYYFFGNCSERIVNFAS